MHHKLTPEVELIIREVAKKNDLPIKLVRDWWDFSMKFTADLIREGSLRSVRHMYLGLFGVTDYRKHVHARRKEEAGEYREWVEKHNLHESESKRESRGKSKNLHYLSEKYKGDL